MESASFLPSCTNGMECELLGSLCEVTDLHRVMEVAKARPQKLRKRRQFLEDFVCELQSKKNALSCSSLCGFFWSTATRQLSSEVTCGHLFFVAAAQGHGARSTGDCFGPEL